jgi:hypothetical protein
MVQRRNYAAATGARVISSMEECVLGMGHRSNDAELKDAQTKLKKEDYVHITHGGGGCVKHGAKKSAKYIGCEGCTSQSTTKGAFLVQLPYLLQINSIIMSFLNDTFIFIHM